MAELRSVGQRRGRAARGAPDPQDLRLAQASLERSVLGALLIGWAEGASLVLSGCRTELLSFEAHRIILSAAGRVAAMGGLPDLITITTELRSSGELARIPDGLAYLAKLAHAAPVTTNLELAIRKLQESAVRKRIGDASLELGSALAEDPASAEEAAGRFVRTVEQIKSASEWPELLPLGQPALPPFPVQVLPRGVAEFVEQLAVATQTPSAMAGLMSLGVLSVCVARKARIEAGPEWREPLNLYTLAVEASGSRKTALLENLIGPVERWEREELGRVGKALAEAHTRRKILEARADHARSKASKASGQKAEDLEDEAVHLAKKLHDCQVPPSPRLLADDVTPEKIPQLLAQHGGRLAIVSDEPGLFGTLAGRYSKGGVENLDCILKAHVGRTITIDRVGRPTEHVSEPALVICLAAQPQAVVRMSQHPGFRDRGLVGRFLFACPESMVGWRVVDPPSVEPQTRAAYHRTLLALLELPSSGAHTLTLSKDAREIFLELQRWLEPQLRPFADFEAMQEWGAKAAGATARIAGILHLADLAGVSDPWREPVPGSTMTRAHHILEFLIPHAKAAYGAMDCDPATEDARYVLRWIERGQRDTFTRREAYQGTKTRLGLVSRLVPVLELLEQHGYIRPRVTGVTGVRQHGEKSHKYAVNPAAWQTGVTGM